MNRQLLLVLVFQIPPGILVALPIAQQHPWLLFGAIVCYECVIFLGAFLRSVWKEELEASAKYATGRLVRSFFAHLFSVLRDWSPTFERRYLKSLITAHSLFNDKGLALINANRVNLESVFVHLKVSSATSLHAVTGNILQQVTGTVARPIWSFLRELSGNGVGLVVIGPPGSGKTTLLQHITLTFARRRQWRHIMWPRIPFLIPLRIYSDEILGRDGYSLAALLRSHLVKSLKIKPPSENRLQAYLQKGKCFILFDGLDEVGDSNSRIKLATWIDAQIQHYSKCMFLVSARPQGYITAPLVRAHLLEIQPFNAYQVANFIKNWYRANEIISSGGRRSSDVIGRANANAAGLLARLVSAPEINALTVNPLLLTMVAMVHRYRGALPGSRVALYKDICDVLLERWRSSKGIADPLRGDQLLAVLKPLAAHMMKLRLRDICTAEAMGVIEPWIRSVGAPSARQKVFLEDLEASSGLLHQRLNGVWSFAHLTFQEYLAACNLRESSGVNIDWKSYVSDSWWHETLRLYCAQGDATAVIKAGLEVGDHTALALMWDCLHEASFVAPECRELAVTRLDEALDGQCIEQRTVAIQAQFTRRLARGFIAVNEKIQIDTTPVMNIEFHAFVAETARPSMMDKSTMWRRGDGVVPKGKGRGDCVGLSFEQCMSFCEWLSSSKYASGWRYRLPTDVDFSDSGQSVPPDRLFWGVGQNGAPILLGEIPHDTMQLLQATAEDLKADLDKRIGLPRLNEALADLSVGRITSLGGFTVEECVFAFSVALCYSWAIAHTTFDSPEVKLLEQSILKNILLPGGKIETRQLIKNYSGQIRLNENALLRSEVVETLAFTALGSFEVNAWASDVEEVLERMNKNQPPNALERALMLAEGASDARKRLLVEASKKDAAFLLADILLLAAGAATTSRFWTSLRRRTSLTGRLISCLYALHTHFRIIALRKSGVLPPCEALLLIRESNIATV